MRDISSEAEAGKTLVGIDLEHVALVGIVRVPEDVVLDEYEDARTRGPRLELGKARELQQGKTAAGEECIRYILAGA